MCLCFDVLNSSLKRGVWRCVGVGVCCCVSIEFLNIYLSFRSNPDRAVAGWGVGFSAHVVQRPYDLT